MHVAEHRVLHAIERRLAVAPGGLRAAERPALDARENRRHGGLLVQWTLHRPDRGPLAAGAEIVRANAHSRRDSDPGRPSAQARGRNLREEKRSSRQWVDAVERARCAAAYSHSHVAGVT